MVVAFTLRLTAGAALLLCCCCSAIEAVVQVSLDGKWTVTASEKLGDDLLNQRRVSLVAHGIDTVCNLSLNGRLLFRTSNMFVRHTADVKGILR
ncbi:hypothetical protein V5799_024026, partial [Amblyomma americanum]